MRGTKRITQVAVATTAAGVLMAGLAIAPASAKSSHSFIGKFHQTTTIASTVPGALFGLAVARGGSGVYYVDDAANTLNLLH